MSRRWSPILVASALMLGVAVPIASPALASKLCPPLSVAAGETCECTVMNYATSHDTNIEINLYRGSDGVVEKCGPGTTRAQSRSICTHTFPEGDTCGCQVTGEGGSVRVSIAVVKKTWADLLGDGTSAKAAMECVK
jgi:hypothetical protein